MSSSYPAARYTAFPVAKSRALPDAFRKETSAHKLEPSDEALVAKIATGDREALAILFRRYSRLVWTVAEKILRDPAEAEDVMQELFISIQRKAHVFDSAKGPARTLIVHMTYQRAISRRRYLATRQFYALDLERRPAQMTAPRLEHYDDSVEAHLGKVGLQTVLAELSDDQRETLRLCFFEGYTLAEISRKLGQPLGNVRHHYYRGLEKLRKQMQKTRSR